MIMIAALLLQAGNPTPGEHFVRVRVNIGADGRVVKCAVVASDAPQSLQDGACRIFLEKARYKPGPMEIEQTVRFRIEDGTPSATNVPATVQR
jgi:hypothetical protein